MHQNRYSGAPDTIMSGSSRGPVDDGRSTDGMLEDKAPVIAS